MTMHEQDTERHLQLSVLDQSPIPEGSGGGDALRNSVELAQLAERLGFARYWVAEHHGTPSLASPSPEILITRIAAATERIRVGSGGVMLPHYSPLKVAETFSMLCAMFPGRIDLGLGRAPGSDPHTAFALQRDRRERSPDDFPEQLNELLGYLNGTLPGEHPFAPLAATLPGQPQSPEAWLLGSSPQSGKWAAAMGLPYMFADFINPHGAEIARNYRQTFQPSEDLAAPRVGVAAWVICADTDAAAQRLASSAAMMFALMHRGQLIPVPPPEKAMQFLEEQGRILNVMGRDRRSIVGTPERVRAGIESLADEYAADEVMLVNIVYDHAARLRSYELVADAFNLPAAKSADAAAAR